MYPPRRIFEPAPPEPPAPPPNSGLARRLRRLALAVAGAILVVALLLAFRSFETSQAQVRQHEIDQAVARALASATPPPPIARQVYETIRPSVVEVDTQSAAGSGKENGARGTGVILDQNGRILTSLHVVAGADQVEVVFADGTRSPAIVQDQAPENDIAVLRALEPPADLVPATLGDPSAVQIGDDAVVVGNPFGISGSLTAGHISGLGRTFLQPGSLRRLNNLIQFDAAVNPGNSGGPLLNAAGEVVGIVVGLVNPTDQDVFIGIGFAVPINTAAAAAGSPPY